MSDFHYIQMPPDGTGKKSSQSGTIELKFSGGILFTLGDQVTSDEGLAGSVIKTEAGEIYLALDHGSTDTVDIGTILKVDGVAIATTTQASDVFYSQDITIVGGGNAFNHVNVDDAGAMYMRFAGGSMSYDAFGKLQSSQSTTIREYLPVYDILPEDFDHRVWNAGVLDTDFQSGSNGDNDIFFDEEKSLVVMQTGTSNGDHVRRRSHLFHKYQTGTATTIIFSAFIADTGKAGVIRNIGFFDDNDGVMFRANENSPDGFECIVRHSVTGSVVEETYKQTEWNVDRLDGSEDSFNISRHALNPTKVQVMFIDFQWLGGGRIRFGFFIDGIPIVCHEVDNANNISRAWCRSGSLPLTMEQYNNAGGVVGNSAFFNISAIVRCEGQFEPRQFLSSGSLPPPVDVYANSSSRYTFIGAVRPVKHISLGDEEELTLTNATFSATLAGSPPTVGTIVCDDTQTIVSGDYIIFNDTNHNNDVVYYVDTVNATTITLTEDSPPLYGDTAATCTVRRQKLTPNRAVGEIKDITLVDVSGSNNPLLVEFVKNAGVGGVDNGTGILTVDTIGGTITGYNDYEIVSISLGAASCTPAIGQVRVSGGNVTSVDIVVSGRGYALSDTGLTLTGKEGGTGCTVDVATLGNSEATFQDAYPGNMLDAAKPSTGAVCANRVTNTVYTTVMKDGHAKLDLREHFEKNTELVHRKAELDDRPDDWTIRVRTFDDAHTAKIAFAISWLEVRT